LFRKSGGGFASGAFAARAEIMDYLAPIGLFTSRNLIRKSIGHGCRIDDVTNVK
jgi:glutamate-1-semialdehyde aminotransferase